MGISVSRVQPAVNGFATRPCRSAAHWCSAVPASGCNCSGWLFGALVGNSAALARPVCVQSCIPRASHVGTGIMWQHCPALGRCLERACSPSVCEQRQTGPHQAIPCSLGIESECCRDEAKTGQRAMSDVMESYVTNDLPPTTSLGVLEADRRSVCISNLCFLAANQDQG